MRRLFFGVFKGGAQEVKVILGKCKGGGVEIIYIYIYISIDYERSTIYIHFSSSGLLTCKYFLFCFVNLPKQNVFLLVIRGLFATPLSIFSFFLFVFPFFLIF